MISFASNLKKPLNMLTHNLGYPRIGSHRELKKANEQYWAGKFRRLSWSKMQKVSAFKTGSCSKTQGLTLFHAMIFPIMIMCWIQA